VQGSICRNNISSTSLLKDMNLTGCNLLLKDMDKDFITDISGLFFHSPPILQIMQWNLD
jgi:hypothetical protein